MSDPKPAVRPSLEFHHSEPYTKAQWDREMTERQNPTDDQLMRSRYYKQGVDEFRAILEHEFWRTHPDGLIHNLPPPNTSGNFHVQVSKIEKDPQDGKLPRKVQQTRIRRACRAAQGARSPKGGHRNAGTTQRRRARSA